MRLISFADMKLCKAVLFVSALVLADEARAQPTPDAFKPIEFVAGSCWTGTFPDGKQTDEHCFEWVYEKMYLRDRHTVRGGKPYQGESLYAWNPADQRLGFFYWNSEGLVGTGYVEQRPDGIVFPQKYLMKTGVMEMQSTWVRTGPDGYRVSVAQRAGDTWKTLWSMNFTRTR